MFLFSWRKKCKLLFDANEGCQIKALFLSGYVVSWWGEQFCNWLLSYQASMGFSFYSLGEEAGIKKGMEQGLEIGIEEGMEKGKEEEKLAVARNLLPILDDAAIVTATGLDPQTIHNLRSQR